MVVVNCILSGVMRVVEVGTVRKNLEVLSDRLKWVCWWLIICQNARFEE